MGVKQIGGSVAFFGGFSDFLGPGGPFRAPGTSELDTACKTTPRSGLRTFFRPMGCQILQNTVKHTVFHGARRKTL